MPSSLEITVFDDKNPSWVLRISEGESGTLVFNMQFEDDIQSGGVVTTDAKRFITLFNTFIDTMESE